MATPERIGRYRLLRRKGEGGMGEVWVALDERLGREVALKRIRSELKDDESRERFWREARAAAAVSHPNVCQLFEIDEDGGELFLTMELLEGEPLSERLRRGPMPLRDALEAGRGILAGLTAIHERGLVHRDLKPANIFLTPAGPKILDFGLARPAVAGVAPDLTRAGEIVGTPRYTAPEQLRGELADARTDLFAAGAILYEMLAGRKAFDGPSAADLVHAVLHENPPALTGSPAVAALDRVLRRALAKRREDRPASAEELARCLAGAGTGSESGGGATPRVLTRLVVLPFRMLRPDPDADFLALSLPDAITTSLSGLSTLAVRSPLAAARFAGEGLDVRRIASEMEVDLVLTGSLLSSGGKVRVSTQLLEAPGGTVLWSQSTLAEPGDVFQIEEDLVRRIVGSLSAPLTAREHRMLGRDVPASAKAYELYLRANELGRRAPTWEEARELYEDCVKEDPAYAPAWARLGRVCRVLAKYRLSGETAPLHVRAGEAFERALALNPELPLAHNLYTFYEVEEGRALPALRRLLKRLEAAPADPDLFAALVMVCRVCGLLDASLAADEQARRLDPAAATSVSYTHLMRGDLPRAIETDVDALPMVSAVVRIALGRREEGLSALRKITASNPDHAVSELIGTLIRVIEGDAAHAERYSHWFLERFLDPEGLFVQSFTFLFGGFGSSALDLLERGVARGFACPQAFDTVPVFAPIAADPRFAAARERAARSHEEALVVYLEQGGPRLLGALEAAEEVPPTIRTRPD